MGTDDTETHTRLLFDAEKFNIFDLRRPIQCNKQEVVISHNKNTKITTTKMTSREFTRNLKVCLRDWGGEFLLKYKKSDGR